MTGAGWPWSQFVYGVVAAVVVMALVIGLVIVGSRPR